MNPSEDKKFELLYSHYDDTYSGIRSSATSRDRFFVGILVLLATMSFQIALPTASGNAIAEFVRRRLDIQSALSISFLGSVIWAALLFFVVRYYQLAVGLERQYHYIHALEDDLSASYSGVPFTREGRFYLNPYPMFSRWIARLYTWVFPLGLVLAITLKIIGEIRLPHVSLIPLVIDVGIYLLIVTATTLYLLHVHLKK